ncbi:MAG: archaemetzincin, partial [Candidatus Omnitrophica bacterium]|nr:archaemetzincin [Candidatus Omnitrophota bacterium]
MIKENGRLTFETFAAEMGKIFSKDDLPQIYGFEARLDKNNALKAGTVTGTHAYLENHQKGSGESTMDIIEESGHMTKVPVMAQAKRIESVVAGMKKVYSQMKTEHGPEAVKQHKAGHIGMPVATAAAAITVTAILTGVGILPLIGIGVAGGLGGLIGGSYLFSKEADKVARQTGKKNWKEYDGTIHSTIGEAIWKEKSAIAKVLAGTVKLAVWPNKPQHAPAHKKQHRMAQLLGLPVVVGIPLLAAALPVILPVAAGIVNPVAMVITIVAAWALHKEYKKERKLGILLSSPAVLAIPAAIAALPLLGPIGMGVSVVAAVALGAALLITRIIQTGSLTAANSRAVGTDGCMAGTDNKIIDWAESPAFRAMKSEDARIKAENSVIKNKLIWERFIELIAQYEEMTPEERVAKFDEIQDKRIAAAYMKWVALRAEGGTTNNVILDSIALESLFSPEAREKEIRRIKGFGGAAYLAKLCLTDGMYEDTDLQNKAEAVKAKLEEQVETVSSEERRTIVAELLEYNGNKWVMKDFESLSSEAVDLHKNYKELAIFLAEYLNLINRMKAEEATDGTLDITLLVNRKIVTDVETAINYSEKFLETLRVKANGIDDVMMRAAYQMMFSESDPAWMVVRAIMSLDIDRFVELVSSLKKSDIEGWAESMKLLDVEWKSKDEKNKKETIEKFIKVLEQLGGFSKDGSLSRLGQALLIGISLKAAFNAKDEMMTIKSLTTTQNINELFNLIDLGNRMLDIAANRDLFVQERKEMYKNIAIAIFRAPQAMTKVDVDNLKDNSILIGKDGQSYSVRSRIVRGGLTMFVISPLDNPDNDESKNSYLTAETVRQDFSIPISADKIEAQMVKTRIRGEVYPETHMIMLDPKTGDITEAQQDTMIKDAVVRINKQMEKENVKEPGKAIVIFVSDLVLKLGLTKSDILERAESLDADIKEVLNANTSREIVIVPTPDKEMVAMAKANGRELNAGKIQFNANDFLATGKKVLSEGKYAYVGFVTAADLFTPQGAGDEMVRKIWTFVFGEGENVSDESGTFVVSTNRVHPQFYGREFDRGSFVAAVVTETLHELGHALGFAHCHNQDCLMGFSSTYDSLLGRSVTGKIGDAYCSECRAHLAGIKGMGSFASTEEARTIAAERRTRREALLKTITTNGLVTVTLEWARDLEKKYGVSIDRGSVDADNYTMIAYEKDANLPW